MAGRRLNVSNMYKVNIVNEIEIYYNEIIGNKFCVIDIF
jgi:hypothetical protein